MDGVLGAGSPAAIRFRRGTKTWATHIPTSHNPQPLAFIVKRQNRRQNDKGIFAA